MVAAPGECHWKLAGDIDGSSSAAMTPAQICSRRVDFQPNNFGALAWMVRIVDGVNQGGMSAYAKPPMAAARRYRGPERRPRASSHPASR